MNVDTHIAVFRGKEIRNTIHGNEWWVAIVDVVSATIPFGITIQMKGTTRGRPMRNDDELSSIRKYILANLLKWADDEEYVS